MFPSPTITATLVALRHADDRRRADRYRATRLARSTADRPDRPPPAGRRRRRWHLSWL